MGEPKKMKKASDEQKEYLLTYMEENIEFAHDRFESFDGLHVKAAKWQMLKTNLNEMGLASIADEMPVVALAGPSSAAMRPTPRKRKKAPSGKNRDLSSFEEKILKIEEEKLEYIKKSYYWKKEYETKLLELRERQISLQEKEFELK